MTTITNIPPANGNPGIIPPWLTGKIKDAHYYDYHRPRTAWDDVLYPPDDDYTISPPKPPQDTL